MRTCVCKREEGQERKDEVVRTPATRMYFCLQARMFNEDLREEKEAVGEKMRREVVGKQGAAMNVGLREQK